MNDDYEYLDEDERDPDSMYLLDEDAEEDSDDPFVDLSNNDDDDDSDNIKVKSDDYEDKLTDFEVKCINAYTEMAKCGTIEEACSYLLHCNPNHTSSLTIINIMTEIFSKQGHNRMQNTRYTREGMMTSREIDEVLEEDDSTDVNELYRQQMKDHIARFVAYLTDRCKDLSKDSVASRRNKQRMLPAFIILLFSSGHYDMIINCPTMPKVYQEQINLAFKRISEMKQAIVEELATAYDDAGRPNVAQRVRDKGLAWFNKEPAEVRGTAEYRDLNLTQDDIDIYKKYRNKYTNLSISLTQDVISEYIFVVEDEKKGIARQLKDKTRADAISDVKKLFATWSSQQEGGEDNQLVKQLIF